MLGPTDATTVAIVNPAAGRGTAVRTWRRVEPLLAGTGRRLVAWCSEQPGHTAELARRAVELGAGTLLVVGGDGTVNEAVNGLLAEPREENRPIVACVPAGTGNDFARGLGIRAASDAIEALRGVSTRAVDVGWVRGAREQVPRAFVNALSAGLGAEVAGALTGRWRRLGPAAFTLIALRAIARSRAVPALVEVDGVAHEVGPSRLLLLANGVFAAGGLKLAPPARLDDGQLDLVALGAVSRLELALRLLPAARSGIHLRHAAVGHTLGRRFALRSAMPYEVDGEVAGSGPMEVWVEPSVLRVFVPDHDHPTQLSTRQA
jgi:YegS/Rv2252/BmrU family lipid kinase